MGRDEPSVAAVPSFFRCPISLDVMESPVSLSTGVTYDRASIQRWLDGGNTVCPATMQVLSSTDLIPNLTLQRLIQIWSHSVRRNSPSPPPSPEPDTDPPLTPEIVLSLARTVSSCSSLRGGGELADALFNISRFGLESEENRRFLAKIDGLASNLLSLLRNAGNGAALSFDSLEKIVIVAEMILSRSENRHSLVSGIHSSISILDNLKMLIRSGSVAVKTAAVKMIELLAIKAETKLAIAATDGVLIQLLSLLSQDSSHHVLIEAGLSCLISLSKPKRIKVALVMFQSILKLSKLLAASSSTAPVIEKSLKLLESLSSCSAGRSVVCGDTQCIELILQKSLKVSGEATERAITILWSLCYLFGDDQAREAVSRGNGLARILMVMQSNCSRAVRQMSRDLVKLFGSSLKRSGLSGYDTKTTHIMPF